MGKVRGIAQVNARLEQIFTQVSEDKARAAITKALIIGQQYAVALTPVDLGNLINSRFTQIINTPTGFTGRVGFTADYASFVHDGGPKNWQKPGAEDEFLKKGFERDGLEEIDAVIRAEMKI